MDRIRVVVVDDHRSVRRGLAIAFRTFDNLELVGEASNGVEAVALCAELCPDVVLMDLIMPEMGGVEATREIHMQCPTTRIIALTATEDTEMVENVLQAGAVGFLLKNATLDKLASTILLSMGVWP